MREVRGVASIKSRMSTLQLVLYYSDPAAVRAKNPNFFNAYLSADNRVTLLDVIPADTVSLTGLMDVVRRVRALVARDVRGLAGAEILVAGFAASNVDTQQALMKRFPETVGLVLGITAGEKRAAYPLTDRQGAYGTRPETVEAGRRGGQRLVLFSDPAARAAAAYVPEVEGRRLTFSPEKGADPPRWVDRETGSSWALEGTCVAGSLKGETLPPASFVRVRWYAWSALYPKSEIVRSRS